MTASVFSDLQFSDRNERQHAHEGMQDFMLNGGDETCPARPVPAQNPDGHDQGQANPKGQVVCVQNGQHGLFEGVDCSGQTEQGQCPKWPTHALQELANGPSHCTVSEGVGITATWTVAVPWIRAVSQRVN